MQKYPSKTIYRHHFPKILGICRSLQYGVLKAETASMLATKTGKNSLPKQCLSQVGKVNSPLHLALKKERERETAAYKK